MIVYNEHMKVTLDKDMVVRTCTTSALFGRL